MNRMHRAAAGLWLAVVGLAAGCGTPINPDTPLRLLGFPEGDPATPTWNLRLALGDAQAQDCHQFSRATQALANGQPLEIVSLGSRGKDALGLPSQSCTGAQFAGKATAAGDGIDEILVLDGSERAVDMRVSSLLAPRTAAWASEPMDAAHPGEDVQIQWSPAGDTLDFGELTTTVRFSDGGEVVGGDTLFTLVGVTDGMITLRVKPELTGSRSGTITLHPRISPKVLRCEGDYRNCQPEVQIATLPTLSLTLQGN